MSKKISVKKIILLELNEVPEEIFVNSFLKSSYKKNLEDFQFNRTISKDKGQLTPWTTWATLHRGVTNEIHGIKDINQDITHLEKTYPSIMSILADKGFKVGVFGSMQSAFVPVENYSKYSFFVPEVFATNSACKPKTINNFQKINLLLSKESQRVVSNKLPGIKLTINAIKSYLKHSYKLNGFLQSIKQLIFEIIWPWKKIRRRSIQSIILFDIYMDLLIKTNPDFSTFFTNHVASNMHRFWEAKFPEHFTTKISSNKWLKRYKNEIDIAMNTTAYFINELTNYVDKNNNIELWILSSMGQAADKTENITSKFFWKINDLKLFISSICEKNMELEELTTMVPIYSIRSDESSIDIINEKLKQLESNSVIAVRSKTKRTIAFRFKSYDLENIWFKNKKNEYIDVKGLRKIKIDENTGTSGNHIPEGILYRYGKDLNIIKKEYINNDGFIETQNIKSIIEETIQI